MQWLVLAQEPSCEEHWSRGQALMSVLILKPQTFLKIGRHFLFNEEFLLPFDNLFFLLPLLSQRPRALRLCLFSQVRPSSNSLPFIFTTQLYVWLPLFPNIPHFYLPFPSSLPSKYIHPVAHSLGVLSVVTDRLLTSINVYADVLWSHGSLHSMGSIYKHLCF